MKFNKVLIYLLVLIAIGGWLYFVEIRHKQVKKAAEEKAAKIIALGKDKIEDIEIRSGDRVIELKKPASQWVLTAPVKTKADDQAIESLLISATDAKAEKTLAEKDVKFEDYGLDKPELTVTLATPEKKAQIAFGARNPSKTSYYARVEGDPRLFLVADSLKGSLDKSVFDLRDKTIMAMAPADVEKVVISQEGKQTELQLDASGKWEMIKPERIKVKKSVMSRNITGLINLQAKEIIDEPQKGDALYGLDNPQRSIQILGKKADHTLLLGKAVEKEGKPTASEPDRYARGKDHDTVYVVDGRTLKELLQVDPGHLQDRSVLTFEPLTVDKLDIELDGKKWLAVKGKDTKWDLEQPEKKSNVDAWPISSILWELKDLEWKSIKRDMSEDLAAIHLDKPGLTISLYRKDAKEPTVVKAGWDVVPPPGKAEAGEAKAAEKVQAEKDKPKAAKQSEKKAVPEEGADKTDAAVKPALPPTMNVIVEPSEEKGAVFVVDSGFVDRLRLDLERLLENKK